MRLIDADEVIKEIEESISIHYKYNENDYECGLREGKERAISFIEDAPTEEVRPKGVWIKVEDPRYEYDRQYDWGAGVFFICSECGKRQSSKMDFDFCPKCGADMRNDNNESEKV